MRKQHYILKLKATDEKIMRLLKYCQHISQEQAQRLGVKPNRLKSLTKEGVIKKIHFINGNHKEFCYELTPKGRKWIDKNLTHLRGNYYTTSSSSCRHNLRLSETVIREVQQGRELLCERDLKELFLNRVQEIEDLRERNEILRAYESREISTCDIGIVTEHGIELIECYNNNYGQAEIDSKTAFAEVLNMNLTFIKQ